MNNRFLKAFSEGFDCSQVVLSSVAKSLGIDEITAKRCQHVLAEECFVEALVEQ